MPSTHSHAEFNINRIFDAPRARVWQAWTDSDLLASWFGPKGSKTDILHFDLRPGGFTHARMETPQGLLWGKFVYREIEAPSRLVYVHSFADAEANIAPSPFGGPWPLELLTMVDFAEEDGRTRINLIWEPMGASDEEVRAFVDNLQSMQQGWSGSFDRLDELLAR